MAKNERGRIRHYGRVMLAGFANLWLLIGVIIIVVGGDLAITFIWGYKHLVWGIPLLLAAFLAMALEGAWKIEVANRSELATEQEALRRTKAELEAERERPVSPGHRDNLKNLARKAAEQVSGARPYRYVDHANPHSDVRAMLAGHFPGPVKLLDIWNEGIAEQDAAGTAVLRMLHEVVSDPNPRVGR